MTSRLITAIVSAAIAAAGASTLAQAPQQQPTFRAGVELVEVQAVVTDAQGNPVTGLTQNDFEVVEGGKPQTIAAFSTVEIPIEREERVLYSPTAIEPDVLSNDRPEGRIYLIAFDDIHPTQALRARRFLRTFIERYVGANDVVAIGYFTVGARESQEFTSNKRVLLRQLDKFTGNIPGESSGSAALANAQANAQAAAAGGDAEQTATQAQAPAQPSLSSLDGLDVEARFRLRNRMKSFRDIVEYLAKVPGQRKSLLYISTGIGDAVSAVIDYQGGVMPIELEDAHVAIRAAATGNVAIYPIDPRGLQADGGGEFTSFEETQSAATPAATRLAEISNARMLADTTGGFAFINQNNFEQALTRLVRENSSYYVLGYYSTDDRRNGRFRRLQVRVKRPGLQVRARTGYLAPRGRPAETRETRQPDKPSPISPATSTALANGVPARGLPLRMFAAPFKSAAKEATVALVLNVDVAALELTEQDGAFTGTLELTSVATDDRSRTLGGEYHTMSLKLRPETVTRARTTGLQVLGEIRLPPGRYQVRAALGNGTKAGSVIYDVDVPDFLQQPLMMSGVALTSRLLANAPTLTAKNPLRDFLPAPPTTTREFSADDTIVVFAEVYDNMKTPAAHTVDITATLRADDGREIRSVSDERSSSELTGATGGFGFRADLPLEGAAPGLYVIHIEARANAGDRPVASRDVTIRVK
jgi:VWFA-related protein